MPNFIKSQVKSVTSASDSDASSFWSTRVTPLAFLENLFNVFLAAPDQWRSFAGKKTQRICRICIWQLLPDLSVILGNLKVAVLSWPIHKYSCEFWMIEQLTSFHRIQATMRCGNVLVLAVLLFLWLSSSCFLLLLCYCFITANTNSCLHRLSLGGLGHCLPVLGCAPTAAWCGLEKTRICMGFLPVDPRIWSAVSGT